MTRPATSASSRPRAFTALAALGALAASAALATPAVASAAQPATDVLQTAVSYSLSDLSTDRGTHALYQRIVTAARSVCPRFDSQDLGAFADSRQCQRQAVARAIHQIGDAHLASLYAKANARRG